MFRVGIGAALALAISMASVAANQTKDCRVPLGYLASPAPVPAPMDALISRSETIEVNIPLADLVAAVDALPMEDQVDPNSPLPRVVGTATLTDGFYGDVGSRRMVCLNDGAFMLEHVILRETNDDTHRFRYQLWNYTSETAKALDYSVGEFVYTALEVDRTQVTWTHGFKLREDTLPGALGGFGKWLFRRNFLEEEYKALMKGTLTHMKRQVTAPAQDAKTGAPSR